MMISVTQRSGNGPGYTISGRWVSILWIVDVRPYDPDDPYPPKGSEIVLVPPDGKRETLYVEESTRHLTQEIRDVWMARYEAKFV